MGKLENYDHMTGNTWSLKLDKEKASTLYSQGYTDVEIAKATNVSAASIFNWRQKNNLNKNIKGLKDREILVKAINDLWEKGFNDREISEELNCKLPTVRYIRFFNLKKEGHLHYKADISLSEFEYQVLIGTSIADGHLCTNAKNTKACINFAHSLAQEGYAQHKVGILSKFDLKVNYYSAIDKRTNNTYYKICVFSKFYKELYEVHKKLYIGKVKYPSKDLISELGPVAFAYIFMDDGYYLRGGAGISFCSFPVEVNQLFVDRLLELGVTSTIHKSGVIYIHRKSFDVFKNLILPYIHKELLYKLNM